MTEYVKIENNQIIYKGTLPRDYENITRFDLADAETIKAKGFLPIEYVKVAACEGYKIIENIEAQTDKVIITETLAALEGEELVAYNEQKRTEYQRLRAAEYPPQADYLDGIVKGDTAQVQAYIDACLAVKLKYPKP